MQKKGPIPALIKKNYYVDSDDDFEHACITRTQLSSSLEKVNFPSLLHNVLFCIYVAVSIYLYICLSLFVPVFTFLSLRLSLYDCIPTSYVFTPPTLRLCLYVSVATSLSLRFCLYVFVFTSLSLRFISVSNHYL